jgi:hypothetical protein
MRIKSELTVQTVGGENVILLQGRHGLDTTKIVSLNHSALWLWNRFRGNGADEGAGAAGAAAGAGFTVDDVAAALVGEYAIGPDLAARDAQAWVDSMIRNALIEQ